MTTQLLNHIPGTHTKLDDDMINSLSNYIKQGNYAVTACHLAGVSEVTYYSWLNKGERDINNGVVESNHAKFLKAIKQAEAEAESDIVQFMIEATKSKKDPYAAMMYLERRVPERWAKKERTTIDINNNQNITLTYKYIIQLAREYEEEQTNIIEGECKEITDGTNRV